MRATRNVELLTNVAVGAALIVYILSCNPSTVQYVKTQFQWLRWHSWNATHPAWLKEALQVRGHF